MSLFSVSARKASIWRQPQVATQNDAGLDKGEICPWKKNERNLWAGSLGSSKGCLCGIAAGPSNWALGPQSFQLLYECWSHRETLGEPRRVPGVNDASCGSLFFQMRRESRPGESGIWCSVTLCATEATEKAIVNDSIWELQRAAFSH